MRERQAVNVLLVEHNPNLRSAIRSRLESWGHQVATVGTRGEAEAALSRNNLSLVLCNYGLPGTNGLELCRSIRGADGGTFTYLIALINSQQEDGLVEALKAGADDCIALPVDWRELEARLHVARRHIELQQYLLDAQHRLVQMSTLDSLTTLWNRRAIMGIMQREFSRHQRQGTPIAVAMLDLDHFKRINDGRGHAVGDEVLREVGARMAAAVRPYDSLGRYGGEEFLLVLPGCEGNGARGIAERLRTAVSQAPIATSAGPISITLSAGVAASDMEVHTPSDLLRAADVALYRAKDDGRNCVRNALSIKKPTKKPCRLLQRPPERAAAVAHALPNGNAPADVPEPSHLRPS